jgi:BirA family biotin operon repressor/biotin-[acetyl-CoA-carboxylase] ligase
MNAVRRKVTTAAVAPHRDDAPGAKRPESRASRLAPALLVSEGMSAVTRLSPGEPSPYGDDDSLCIDLIRRGLSTRSVGFQIHLFGAVSSTNDVACRLAEDGAREGTVVLAESQRIGQRRFGRPWFSPARANLYASVVFRPAIAPRAVPVFALIGSLALADAIAAEGLPAAVRWPNEVVIGARKVGGTLAKAATVGDVVQHVVLGLGVNLNVSGEALARALPAATFATSVREAAGRPIDRNGFTASVLNHLERWHERYLEGGPGAVLLAWNQRDAVRGRVVEVSEAEGMRRGYVTGVDEQGRLVLEQRPGRERAVASGEIATIEGERAR